MTEEEQQGNWIMFDGTFVVPAGLAGAILAKAITVRRQYGKPIEMGHDKLEIQVLSGETIVAMIARHKILDGKEAA